MSSVTDAIDVLAFVLEANSDSVILACAGKASSDGQGCVKSLNMCFIQFYSALWLLTYLAE